MEPERIELRKTSLKDLEQLQHIGRQTFYETFSAGNTEENMNTYLEENFSFKKLSAELSDQNSEFYLALCGTSVIGYLKLNFGPAQTELKDVHAAEIERIYAAKEFHGKKAGQLLYNKAIDVCRDKGLSYVWLGVWEENHRAIRFYEKNGFVEFDRHIFKLGGDEQTDLMMKLTLRD